MTSDDHAKHLSWSMHPSGPPRKFFRPSWSGSGPRLPSRGTQQDFTVDCDTPPGAFHQSSQSPYYPPPPMEGVPPRFAHGPPGGHPMFSSYPPPHYPMPPWYGYSPQPWGHGYGQQRWNGRRGRGRGGYGGGRGFRGRGGRYPQSKWRNEGASADNIDAYYSKTMFDDPWKDLLPQGDQNEGTATPASIGGTQVCDCPSSNTDQEVDASKIGKTTEEQCVGDVQPNEDKILSVGSVDGTCTKEEHDLQASAEMESSPLMNIEDEEYDVMKKDDPGSNGTESTENLNSPNSNPMEIELQNQG